jgi:hypothetical protein
MAAGTASLQSSGLALDLGGRWLEQGEGRDLEIRGQDTVTA